MSIKSLKVRTKPGRVHGYPYCERCALGFVHRTFKRLIDVICIQLVIFSESTLDPDNRTVHFFELVGRIFLKCRDSASAFRNQTELKALLLDTAAAEKVGLIVRTPELDQTAILEITPPTMRIQLVHKR